MDSIDRVAIVGGTHGNELTGAYLIKKFRRHPEAIARESFETQTLLGNPEALQARQRYLDKDLNRCFGSQALQDPNPATREDRRAQQIDRALGPKGNAQVDFILDLHTTSANMGASLIFVRDEPFDFQLAARLCAADPSLGVYSWIEPEREPNFLNAIASRGFAIEVGPITPGTLAPEIFATTERLVHAVLDGIDAFNRQRWSQPAPPLTVYRHQRRIDYPKTSDGDLDGFIHPQRQGRDFEAMAPGDPLFLTLDGHAIGYDGPEVVHPVFVNEAAYYEKGIAMCLTQPERMAL